jgi:hypothetical protein
MANEKAFPIASQKFEEVEGNPGGRGGNSLVCGSPEKRTEYVEREMTEALGCSGMWRKIERDRT